MSGIKKISSHETVVPCEEIPISCEEIFFKCDIVFRNTNLFVLILYLRDFFLF